MPMCGECLSQGGSDAFCPDACFQSLVLVFFAYPAVFNESLETRARVSGGTLEAPPFIAESRHRHYSRMFLGT